MIDPMPDSKPMMRKLVWEVMEGEKYANRQRERINSSIPERGSIFEDVEASFPFPGGDRCKGERPPSRHRCRISAPCTPSTAPSSRTRRPSPPSPSPSTRSASARPSRGARPTWRAWTGCGSPPLARPRRRGPAQDGHRGRKVGGARGRRPPRPPAARAPPLRAAHSLCQPPLRPRRAHPRPGQGRREPLFAALHDAGYRVISNLPNSGDRCCAEFALALNETSAGAALPPAAAAGLAAADRPAR